MTGDGDPRELFPLAQAAVQKALAFAKKDGNTLVVVTADHAHASQIIPSDAKAPGLTQALGDGLHSLESISASAKDTHAVFGALRTSHDFLDTLLDKKS